MSDKTFKNNFRFETNMKKNQQRSDTQPENLPFICSTDGQVQNI